MNARPENVSLLQNANDQINTAKDALTEAENALSAYNEQQNNSSSASYDEQLKTLYDDYKAKEEAYNEAVKQRQSTISLRTGRWRMPKHLRTLILRRH
ncbi:MAG: hypothetical protein ACLR5Q_04410 [Coprococcus sp.]